MQNFVAAVLARCRHFGLQGTINYLHLIEWKAFGGYGTIVLYTSNSIYQESPADPAINAQNSSILRLRIQRPSPHRLSTKVRRPPGLKHLNARPADHCRIIGAQVRRRRDDADMFKTTDVEERPEDGHQELVRSHAAADDQCFDLLVA